MTHQRRTGLLVVLDGFGHRAEHDGNAIAAARTPTWDALWSAAPHALISGSGHDVGLPAGQMGNSEVGHLNLGAGRIVYQDLTRINKAIADGELPQNKPAQETFARARGHRLHFLGLVSDGGVHSHYEHLIALANAAKGGGVEDIVVHAFTDGRDTSPTGGAGFLEACAAGLTNSGARIVAGVGRYLAMARDRRWDRTKKAWDAIVLGRGEVRNDTPTEALRDEYAKGTTDEFMPPLIFALANEQRVHDGDTVFFFNFRADRARQLSQAFLFDDF